MTTPLAEAMGMVEEVARIHAQGTCLDEKRYPETSVPQPLATTHTIRPRVVRCTTLALSLLCHRR